MKTRSYGLASEITQLRGQNDAYLKRDDELSFGVSGSKWRKLASLIPALLELQPRPVWLVGGLNSNSILAAAQLFREAGLIFRILIPPYYQLRSNGNLALQILRPEEIKVVSRGSMEATLTSLRRLNSSGDIVLVEEGLDHPAAYAGAATLATDLHRNEAELQSCAAKPRTPARGFFRHVFIDAGTGISAAALIVADVQAGYSRSYHVVLVAGDEGYFRRQLAKVAKHLGLEQGRHEAVLVRFYRPRVGKSFGSTPRAVLDIIQRVARQEGVFLDPLYTAKTYDVFAHHSPALEGAKVMIHTGGGLSLAGALPKLSYRSPT